MREPIAWLNPDPDYEQICPEIGYEATYCEQHPKDLGWIPLYTQREWVGLTLSEIFAIGKELGLKCSLGGNPHIDIDYANAIEQRLKEKNT